MRVPLNSANLLSYRSMEERLAGNKISGTPNVFLVLCFFLFFVHVIIFFSVTDYLLLLLLTAPLGIIALVFNIIGVLDIVGHFLQNPCGSAANFVTRESR
jgi:hypothetical protein